MPNYRIDHTGGTATIRTRKGSEENFLFNLLLTNSALEDEYAALVRVLYDAPKDSVNDLYAQFADGVISYVCEDYGLTDLLHNNDVHFACTADAPYIDGTLLTAPLYFSTWFPAFHIAQKYICTVKRPISLDVAFTNKRVSGMERLVTPVTEIPAELTHLATSDSYGFSDAMLARPTPITPALYKKLSTMAHNVLTGAITEVLGDLTQDIARATALVNEEIVTIAIPARSYYQLGVIAQTSLQSYIVHTSDAEDA
jgi:hypothetical protein